MSAPPLHPFWRLVLCALALFAVSAAVLGVGIGILSGRAPQLGLGGLSQEQLLKRLIHDYGLWLTVLSYPPALAILWAFRAKVDRLSWNSLGFTGSRALPNFGRGALAAFLTLGVLFSLLWLTGIIRFGGLSSEVQTRGWAFSLVALGGYLLAFLAVGFMEEVVFRGYALHNLCSWLGWRGAVALQAVVFALVHLGNAGSDRSALLAAAVALPSLTLIAVFFAVSYRKTGSLWFPIGFHAAWNFCLGCVFSQPVSSISTFRLFDVQENPNSWLSGGQFGAEGSLFLIPLVLALITFLSLAPDHPRALANLNSTEIKAPPAVAPLSAPTESKIESEEEERTNRYNARFGSATGFDSDTLRELKQMQEARDQAERERLEAQRAARREEERRLEEERRARFAEPLIPVEPQVTEAPVAVEVATEAEARIKVQAEAPIAVFEAKREEVPPVEAQPQHEAAPPEVVAAPETPSAPPAEAPPKKARPRW